jgi:hypothetical protein
MVDTKQIEELIRMLQSPNSNTRYEACEYLRVAPSITPEALEALKNAINDPDASVAEAAQQALNLHLILALERSSKQPQTPQDKTKREFGLGLTISMLGNGFVALILLCQLPYSLNRGGITQSLWGIGVVWFLINFLIMIYLYQRRQHVFQGMVAGFAIGFLIAIISGIFWGAICFSAEGWI